MKRIISLFMLCGMVMFVFTAQLLGVHGITKPLGVVMSENDAGAEGGALEGSVAVGGDEAAGSGTYVEGGEAAGGDMLASGSEGKADDNSAAGGGEAAGGTEQVVGANDKAVAGVKVDEAAKNGKTSDMTSAGKLCKASDAASSGRAGKASDAASSGRAGKASDSASTGKSGSVSDEAADYDASKLVLLDKAQTMYVKSSVNVRKGPSTQYDLLGNVQGGAEVKVLGQYGTKGWYYIEYGEEKGFVSNHYLVASKEEYEAAKAAADAKVAANSPGDAQTQTQAAVNVSGNAQAQAKAVAEAKAASAQAEVKPQIASVVLIGDSRCVQMKEAVQGGGVSWVCENGKGYDWLTSKAIGQAERIIGKGTKVVVCLGVNDTEHVQQYATLINGKAAEWAALGAKTYYVSVNPVTTNPHRTEEEVETFNSTMPGLLSGVNWIDTHSYLINNGYTSVDGMHYNTDTYNTIFSLIISSL